MLLRCETLLSPLAISKDIVLDAKTRPLKKKNRTKHADCETLQVHTLANPNY